MRPLRTMMSLRVFLAEIEIHSYPHSRFKQRHQIIPRIDTVDIAHHLERWVKSEVQLWPSVSGSGKKAGGLCEPARFRLACLFACEHFNLVEIVL